MEIFNNYKLSLAVVATDSIDITTELYSMVGMTEKGLQYMSRVKTTNTAMKQAVKLALKTLA